MALSLQELHQEISNPNKMAVVSPDGTFGFIDAAEKEDAFKKGYTTATPDQIQNELYYKEFGEGLVDQAAAGTAGVLRGITFGLSDPIIAGAAGGFDLPFTDIRVPGLAQGISALTGRPIREDLTAGGVLAQLEQQNPTLSTGTEIAGAILPAVLTGGGSAGATAASMGARTVGKEALKRGLTGNITGAAALLGGAAEHKIASAIINFGRGRVGAGLAKKIAGTAGMAGSGAIEGGLYGAGDYISRYTLEQEPEFTAEGLISHLGSNALIGGTTGGLIGGVKELVPPLVRNTGNLFIKGVGAAADSIAPNFADKAKDVYSKFSSWRTGVPAEDIRQLLNPATTADLTDLVSPGTAEKLKEGGRLTAETKEALYEKIYNNYRVFIEGAKTEGDPAVASVGQMAKLYNKSIGPEEIKVLLHEIDPQKAAQKAQLALKTAEDLELGMDKVASHMADNPDRFLAKDYINNFNNFVLQYGRRLGDIKKIIAQDPNALTAENMYKFITQERKILDNLIKYDQNIPANQLETINSLKEVRRIFKEKLIDPTIWGDPITRVGEVNEALSSYMTALANFKGAFGKKLITQSGGVEYVVNPATIKGFFKDPNNANNLYRKQVLKELHQQSFDLLKTLNKSEVAASNPAWGVGADRALKEFAKAVDQNNTALDLLESDRLFGEVKRQAEGAGIVEYLPLAGWMSGAAGPLLALPAAVLAKTGKDPAAEIQLARAVARATKKIPDLLGKSLKEFAEVTDKATERIPLLEAKRKEEKKKAPDYKAYSELAKSLENNPELLNKNLLYGTSEIEAVSPLIGGIMREKAAKINSFIISKIPKSFQPDPLRPNLVIPPSRNEQAKFERYMKAINKPLSVFEDMSQGIISPEGIEVLKELYPSIYNKFYEITLNQISEGKLSRRARVKLEAALNITSESLARKQSVYQPSAPEQGAGGGRKLEQGGINRLLKSEAGSGQEIE